MHEAVVFEAGVTEGELSLQFGRSDWKMTFGTCRVRFLLFLLQNTVFNYFDFFFNYDRKRCALSRMLRAYVCNINIGFSLVSPLLTVKASFQRRFKVGLTVSSQISTMY